MKYKLYLTLISQEDRSIVTSKTMFVDSSTIGRHDIYGEAVEDMYNTLSDVHPTPLEVDLSPNDEVYGGNN